MPNVTQLDLIRLAKEPPGKIIEWFRSKGFRISWDWREVWQSEHDRAFTVARAMKRDVLQVLKDGVQQAIEQGWSERRFIQEMAPALQALGWWGRQSIINPAGNLQLVQLGSPWRLKTIYRTNLSVAFARGRYALLKANEVNRPIWVYDAKNDDRTRETHRALDNKAWRSDDPIWQRIAPPNGFACRCKIRALTEEQAAERGLVVGGSQTLPEGFPDDGWDFNPATQTIEQLAVKIAPKVPTRAVGG